MKIALFFRKLRIKNTDYRSIKSKIKALMSFENYLTAQEKYFNVYKKLGFH